MTLRQQNYTTNHLIHGKLQLTPALFEGTLFGVEWWFRIDVSGQHIGPIFKGKAIQEVLDCLTLLDCLKLEDGTDILSRRFQSHFSVA